MYDKQAKLNDEAGACSSINESYAHENALETPKESAQIVNKLWVSIKNVDDASSNHAGEKKQLTQPKPNEVSFGVTPNQISLDTWRSTARSNTDTRKDESTTKIQNIH